MVYRGLYSYRQRVRVITLSPNNFYLLFLHVERVYKRFWNESLTRASSHLHNAARSLSSPSRWFQLQTNLGKDIFRSLWYCGKNSANRKWFSVALVNVFHWFGINWHVFNQSECINCCLYIIIQKITPQAKSGKYCQIWFSPDLGEK